MKTKDIFVIGLLILMPGALAACTLLLGIRLGEGVCS